MSGSNRAHLLAQTQMFFSSVLKAPAASAAIKMDDFALPEITREADGYQCEPALYKVTKPVLLALSAKLKAMEANDDNLMLFIRLQAIWHDEPALAMYDDAYFGDQLEGLSLSVMTKADIAQMVEHSARELIHFAYKEFHFDAFYASEAVYQPIHSQLSRLMTPEVLELFDDTMLYKECSLDGCFNLRRIRTAGKKKPSEYRTLEISDGEYAKTRGLPLEKIEFETIAYLIWRDPDYLSNWLGGASAFEFGRLLKRLAYHGSDKLAELLPRLIFYVVTLLEDASVHLRLLEALSEKRDVFIPTHTQPLAQEMLSRFSFELSEGVLAKLPFHESFERLMAQGLKQPEVYARLLSTHPQMFYEKSTAVVWLNAFEQYLGLAGESPLPQVKVTCPSSVTLEQQNRINLYLAWRYLEHAPVSLSSFTYPVAPQMLLDYRCDLLENLMSEHAKRSADSVNPQLAYWGLDDALECYRELIPDALNPGALCELIKSILAYVVSLPIEGAEGFSAEHKVKRAFLNELLNGVTTNLLHQTLDALPTLVSNLKADHSWTDAASLSWGWHSRTTALIAEYEKWICDVGAENFINPIRVEIALLKDTILDAASLCAATSGGLLAAALGSTVAVGDGEQKAPTLPLRTNLLMGAFVHVPPAHEFPPEEDVPAL